MRVPWFRAVVLCRNRSHGQSNACFISVYKTFTSCPLPSPKIRMVELSGTRETGHTSGQVCYSLNADRHYHFLLVGLLEPGFPTYQLRETPACPLFFLPNLEILLSCCYAVTVGTDIIIPRATQKHFSIRSHMVRNHEVTHFGKYTV